MFGIVVSALTARILGSMHLLAMGHIEKENWPTQLMLSLGAGLYEELFFRVILVSALAAGARDFWGRIVDWLGSWRLLSARLSFRRSIISGPTGTLFKSSRSPFAPSAASCSARYTLSAASASPPGRTHCTTRSSCSSRIICSKCSKDLRGELLCRGVPK